MKHVENDSYTRTVVPLRQRPITYLFSVPFSNPIHYVLLHSEKDRRVSRPMAQLSTTFAALISPVRSTPTLLTLRCIGSFSRSLHKNSSGFSSKDGRALQKLDIK